MSILEQIEIFLIYGTEPKSTIPQSNVIFVILIGQEHVIHVMRVIFYAHLHEVGLFACLSDDVEAGLGRLV
jgi:hypothetical protein